MFTGIIEEKSKVRRISRTSQGYRLTVYSAVVSKSVRLGDSISVNGVCLTVVQVRDKDISFDVMEETLRRTNLSGFSVGETVNLEGALKIGDKISGHFVTGHVDCVGKIRTISKRPNDTAMDIEFPADKQAYLAGKGSVAVDGVSLTVAEIIGSILRVYLIPLTLKATDLGSKKVGDSVNIEFDILSKYIMKEPQSAKERGGIDINFLKEHGFL